ncbi:hypothetical protein Tco_0645971 [Tanacetum coccineum]
MEKFETPPDSPPVIDPDDQPMWSSTRIVVPTPRPAIVQLSISNNFHIKEINNLFQYGENQEEAVMLRTFPFSLSGEAKTWFKRLLNEIHSFHQLNHDSLVEAWLRMKEMLPTCYGHGQTKGAIIQIFYHGLDDPTQGILDAGGIFLYKTPNKVFTILEDKVLLKLDFLDDFQNNPKSKTVVSAGGSNLNSDHAILMDKFETLATKIDSKFLIVRKEFKEMRDSRSDDEGNHASQIYMRDDTPMCEPEQVLVNYTALASVKTSLEMASSALFDCVGLIRLRFLAEFFVLLFALCLALDSFSEGFRKGDMTDSTITFSVGSSCAERTKPDVDTLYIEVLLQITLGFLAGNTVVLAGFYDEGIYSLLPNNQKTGDLLHEDLEQIDDLDIEEMDINWQIAMIAIRMKKFYKKTGRRWKVQNRGHMWKEEERLSLSTPRKVAGKAREESIGLADNG